MSVTTARCQVDQQRRRDPRPVTTGRMWSRRSTEHPECVVARVEGELDAVLHEELRALLERCRAGLCRAVVLDLRATTFMSIRAAVILAEAKAAAWRAGVELRVVSGRKEVERALEVAGVRPQFEYFPSLNSALTS
ncbi:STAS domain-containing protein [Nocardia rhamnosiphila]|uniref:STAS domain-containing protein n=1 Tax=Nocardia rhamnosiphila TaxID=426716 RepID=A0ABV2WW97_9NOCA|nr:STAS domain-containing protein [Nocardia rhamnosiphila]